MGATFTPLSFGFMVALLLTLPVALWFTYTVTSRCASYWPLSALVCGVVLSVLHLALPLLIGPAVAPSIFGGVSLFLAVAGPMVLGIGAYHLGRLRSAAS
jgi:hypothetical protein